MKSTELINKIKENNLQIIMFHINNKGEYLEETEFETEEELTAKFEELDFGEIKEVDSVCNSDEMYSVVHFVKHNVYLMLTGEYDSYGSDEHDYDCGIKEVNPKEKTITVYE